MIDNSWKSVADLVAQIQSGKTSSVELLEHFVARHRAAHSDLNAVIATNLEHARERAADADAAAARGESWGPLHGLPMTLKDTYEVVGMNTVAGASELKDYAPQQNAAVAQKLIDAGAVIWGKTNTPKFAADVQTYNRVFGTTNNPWGTNHTSGGSSGGAAAAVAAGITPIEVGSDIGGSIRTPANFCGIFGHKPTHGIVSLRGHIPGPPGTLSEPDLAVAGPMARTVADLELVLDVIAGPTPLQQIGWRLELPAARFDALADARVAMWFHDESGPIENEVGAMLEQFAENLRGRVAKIEPAIPQSLESIFDNYLKLLSSIMGSSLPKSQYQQLKLTAPFSGTRRLMGQPAYMDAYFNGAVQSHSRWLSNNEGRAKLQAVCARFFEKYDVLLMPVTPVPAFVHDHEFILKRKLPINGQPHSYFEIFRWISLATAAGLPATVAPIGVTRAGLPVCVQIIAPYLEDRTSLAFARLIESECGGFSAPPNYA